MKATKIIISSVAAVSLLVSSAFTVYADDEKKPVGYVTMTAEKFVLGQGFVAEPQLVPFYENENGVDITERFLGKENINGGNGVGNFVSSIADSNTAKAEIPEFIIKAVTQAKGTIDYKRSSEGWLNGMDYYSTSGWIYVVNNKSASSGLSDFKPADGDVVRFEFSVFGYGSDLGFDNSSWGGSPALVTLTDRDELYTVMAKSKDMAKTDEAVKSAYASAVSAASDLMTPLAKLDEVSVSLKNAFDAAAATTTVTEVQTAAETTVSETAAATTASTTGATTVSTTATSAATTTKAEKSPSTGDTPITALIISAGAALTAGLLSKKRNK